MSSGLEQERPLGAPRPGEADRLTTDGSSRRERRGALAVIAAAVCLLLATLETVHLVRISAFESQYLPICRVDTTERLVSLTFDDGPDPRYTSRIISMLERYDGRGTFFLIGSHASRYPDLVSAELEAGMELGNHTWSHVRHDLLSTAEMITQVERTDVILSEAGAGSGLFRAPFGDMTADQSRALARSGFLPIHWSLAVDHYVGGLGMSPSDDAESLAREVQPGDIILAHDAQIGHRDVQDERRRAFETLVLLLPKLRASGFRFVPVTELLAQGSKVRARPRPWFWQSGFACPSA
jgi:peptidoglycan/xylan/chitin deacetylase (PgdA/CDA1 family)